MQKYGILKFLISLLMIILIMQFSLASFYNVFAESNTEIAQHDETSCSIMTARMESQK